MPIKNQKKHRRRYAAPIGGLFVVLALIGIVTVVISSIRLTNRVLDNTSEKERFAEIIRPVAMFDPPPFEDPAAISMEELLRYSMWAMLRSEKRSSYEYDDFSELVVPASDLDVACARLFGKDIQLLHRTFGDNDAKYIYDETEQVYNVPPAAQLYVYNPVVEEITKEGEYYRLIVGYVPPETAYDIGGAKPEKYMIYLMRQSGDSYLIAKVQDPPSVSSGGAPLDGAAGQQP